MSHEPAEKQAAPARDEIPDKGPVGLVALWRVVSWGRWYISIPTGWEDWPDDNPDDSFRRYETRCISIQRDKPSDWEPKRPCYYRWRYDGRPQRVLAGFGLCVRIGHWNEDRQLLSANAELSDAGTQDAHNANARRSPHSLQ